jgi:hypothetical protein
MKRRQLAQALLPRTQIGRQAARSRTRDEVIE